MREPSKSVVQATTKLCRAARNLLFENRRISIYADDEWRTARRQLEDAVDEAEEIINAPAE
jgi:hypothetical protein